MGGTGEKGGCGIKCYNDDAALIGREGMVYAATVVG